MARPKGSPKLGGRQKGTPNKINKDIGEALIESFYILGGVNYLVEQGRVNPVAYMSFLGKKLPKEINATVDSNLTIIINKPDCSTLLDK